MYKKKQQTKSEKAAKTSKTTKTTKIPSPLSKQIQELQLSLKSIQPDKITTSTNIFKSRKKKDNHMGLNSSIQKSINKLRDHS